MRVAAVCIIMAKTIPFYGVHSSGNRMQNEKSEVMFDIGNTRIDVISKAYDVSSLTSIAQTEVVA